MMGPVSGPITSHSRCGEIWRGANGEILKKCECVKPCSVHRVGAAIHSLPQDCRTQASTLLFSSRLQAPETELLQQATQFIVDAMNASMRMPVVIDLRRTVLRVDVRVRERSWRHP